VIVAAHVCIPIGSHEVTVVGHVYIPNGWCVVMHTLFASTRSFDSGASGPLRQNSLPTLCERLEKPIALVTENSERLRWLENMVYIAGQLNGRLAGRDGPMSSKAAALDAAVTRIAHSDDAPTAGPALSGAEIDRRMARAFR
jgi:hypothetical protein